MAKLQLTDRVVEVPDETVAGLTQALGSKDMAAAALRASMDQEYGRRLMAAVNDPSQPEWTKDVGKLVMGMRGIGKQRPQAAAPQEPPPPPPAAPAPSPFQQQGPMPGAPQARMTLNDILGPLMGRLS